MIVFFQMVEGKILQIEKKGHKKGVGIIMFIFAISKSWRRSMAQILWEKYLLWSAMLNVLPYKHHKSLTHIHNSSMDENGMSLLI